MLIINFIKLIVLNFSKILNTKSNIVIWNFGNRWKKNDDTTRDSTLILLLLNTKSFDLEPDKQWLRKN